MQKKGGIEQNVLDKEVRKDTTVAYGHESLEVNL